jgi:hypothetical protein
MYRSSLCSGCAYQSLLMTQQHQHARCSSCSLARAYALTAAAIFASLRTQQQDVVHDATSSSSSTSGRPAIAEVTVTGTLNGESLVVTRRKVTRRTLKNIIITYTYIYIHVYIILSVYTTAMASCHQYCEPQATATIAVPLQALSARALLLKYTCLKIVSSTTDTVV